MGYQSAGETQGMRSVRRPGRAVVGLPDQFVRRDPDHRRATCRRVGDVAVRRNGEGAGCCVLTTRARNDDSPARVISRTAAARCDLAGCQTMSTRQTRQLHHDHRGTAEHGRATCRGGGAVFRNGDGAGFLPRARKGVPVAPSLYRLAVARCDHDSFQIMTFRQIQGNGHRRRGWWGCLLAAPAAASQCDDQQNTCEDQRRLGYGSSHVKSPP